MYSLTEYKVGGKLMTLCAIALILFSFYLYQKVEAIATEMYTIEKLHTQ
ncbi:MAG: hypothetical protein RI996_325 [Candidatus Parcubacteria bacterium]|jgi:hypothetical protein